MRTIILAIACVALLFAPAARAQRVRPARRTREFAVELQFLPPAEAFARCKALGMWPGVERMPRGRAVGCNLFYPDRQPPLCVIVTPEPEEVDDGETANLGHELYHCAAGEYHD